MPGPSKIDHLIGLISAVEALPTATAQVRELVGRGELSADQAREEGYDIDGDGSASESGASASDSDDAGSGSGDDGGSASEDKSVSQDESGSGSEDGASGSEEEQLISLADVKLDRLRWDLCQALNNSRPCRIVEAVPHVRKILTLWDRNYPGELSIAPGFYLAVALSKTPGGEAEAERWFEKLIKHPQVRVPGSEWADRELWGRGHYSRMLRRLGREEEAEKQEKWLRNWIAGHPFGMSMDRFRWLVLDPEHDGPDYILGLKDAKKHEKALGRMGVVSTGTASMVVGPASLDEFCANCRTATLTMQRCSRCKAARYCSVDCQTEHWAEHKKVCKRPPKD